MTKFALAAARAAGCAAMTPAAAFAPAAGQAVGYADLDLSHPAGVARLRQRIAAALEDVCGSYAASEPWAEREIARCRAGAQARADAQLARLVERNVELARAGTGAAGR